MTQDFVHPDQPLPIGTLVRRGPDWQWGDQDDFKGKQVHGIVSQPSVGAGWVYVRWFGQEKVNAYRYGAAPAFGRDGEKFDLRVVEHLKHHRDGVDLFAFMVGDGHGWMWVWALNSEDAGNFWPSRERDIIPLDREALEQTRFHIPGGGGFMPLLAEMTRMVEAHGRCLVACSGF